MGESETDTEFYTDYLPAFEDVRTRELAAIKARWGRREVDEKNLVGIAVSGGGIRSASFAIGVLQKLSLAGKLDEAHYLSTVSGGGYAGSSLTWFLSRPDCGYGVTAADCPFVGGPAGGIRKQKRGSVDDQSIATGRPTGREIIDYIRQRSSYLVSGGGYGLLSAIGIVLRSLVVSVLAYVILFTLLGLALHGPLIAARHAQILDMLLWIAGGFALVPVVGAFLYSIVAPAPFEFVRKGGYALRRGYQRMVGNVLAVALILLLVWLWLWIVWRGGTTGSQLWNLELQTDGAAATVGSVLAGAVLHRLQSALPRIAAYLMPLAAPLILLGMLTGLGLLGYGLAGSLLEPMFDWRWEVGIGCLAAFFLFYANTNLTGLHRFYRDRLMEAFMPDVERLRWDRPHEPTTADTALLSDMFDPDRKGPYHLINSNVVLLDGAHGRYRSRQSDSFVLAPLYCGSDATGWAHSRAWLAERKIGLIRSVGPMTLPTAMAISGAAVNPNTGLSRSAPTRGGALSALMTALNIRLGYWAPSPRLLEGGGRSLFYPPNFVLPGLTHGIFGWGRNEKANWLELTDGGHFDNIGLYELVRRRVRTVYLIDGTEDSDTTLASFANAAEKAFIDFDVKIDFDPETSFIDLMRGAAGGDDPLNAAYRLAKNGYAIGTITYPDWTNPDGSKEKFVGTLLYIKATLTKDLPPALYSYRAANPTYPSQSTLDQFFDEEQFEAYRALGFSVAKQLTERRPRMTAAQRWARSRAAAATRGQMNG